MSARLLAAIVQASEAAIISGTLEGIVTSWNRGAERIFGFTAAEMIGRPVDIIASPGRPSEMREILDRVREGVVVEQYETERRRNDGRLVPVSLTVSPVTDARGRVVGVSKILVDISARRKVEAELAEKTRKLEEFAHALDLAPAMVRTLDGEILHWGRGLQALYGWTAEEAVGRLADELLATEPPALLDEAREALLRDGEWRGELSHSHHEGHRLAVMSHWALHRDAEGRPISVVEVNQDVTEQRWAVDMLEEREARLRSVLETAPDAIITIDEHGIIQSFSHSAERIFGYAAGEVVGRNVKLLMPAQEGRKHDGYMRRYQRTREKHIIGIGRQVEAIRKSGRSFPVELAVGEVVHGGVRIFTGFIRDITLRTRLEQDLRQAQKMEAIGQLTGGIAHDFNNLLTVIQGNLELLQTRMKGLEARELVTDALEATELGAQLSQRLLAFGRRQPLDPKPVDLNALVSGITDLLRRTLGKAVRVETRLTGGLPITLADPGQIENALLNLAINARDAMPEGGVVLVETDRIEIGGETNRGGEADDILPGTYVTLSVTDTGTGMTQDVRQRAFEPYFTTKPAGSGSGLGLSMVYGFVKQSGGHVQLISEPGAGTTVRIFLRATEAGPAARRVPSGASARRARRRSVLVVEDDARVRRTTVRRLGRLGYDVTEADSGSAALEVLERLGPTGGVDLLFSDVIMPGGMSGFQLAREAQRRFPGLRVLLTSGYADPADVEEGLAAEHTDWIGKPYAIEELEARLRDLLTD